MGPALRRSVPTDIQEGLALPFYHKNVKIDKDDKTYQPYQDEKECKMVQQVEALASYRTIAQIAAETGKKTEAIYAFIRKYNHSHPDQELELYRFPTTGKVLYLDKKNADMLKELFLHPEQFAQKVKI
jgi:hypothetical protein